MNENFMLQGATKLNKKEMKSVKGGQTYSFHCKCNGTGEWYGNGYNDGGAAAIELYCGSAGGSCTKGIYQPMSI